MDFFRKNLEETIQAVNKQIENKDFYISVKKVKIENRIRSRNRSKSAFYARALRFLEQSKLLKENGAKSPKKYRIISPKKIDINDLYPKKNE